MPFRWPSLAHKRRGVIYQREGIMPFRPTSPITQQFTVEYTYAGGVITDTMTYLPGEVSRHPMPKIHDTDDQGNLRYDDGQPVMRAERPEEWLDRVAPGSFANADGDIVTAVEFVQLYPDQRFLIRALEAAIVRDSDPFGNNKRLRII